MTKCKAEKRLAELKTLPAPGIPVPVLSNCICLLAHLQHADKASARLRAQKDALEDASIYVFYGITPKCSVMDGGDVTQHISDHFSPLSQTKSCLKSGKQTRKAGGGARVSRARWEKRRLREQLC